TAAGGRRRHDRGGDPRGTEARGLRRGLGARRRGRRPGAAHRALGAAAARSGSARERRARAPEGPARARPHRAGAHHHGARRGVRSRGRPGCGGGRLPHQALRSGRARGAHPGAAAPQGRPLGAEHRVPGRGAGPGGASRHARRHRDRTLAAGIRAAATAARAPGSDPVARPDRGAPVRLGRGSGEQRRGGSHSRAAPQARGAVHSHRTRRWLSREARAMSSLRARLLAWLLGGVVLVGAAGGWTVYRNALSEADAFFDYHLRQTALILRDQPVEYLLAPQLPPADAAYDFVVQVWSLDGVRVYLSRPHAVLPQITTLGFATVATSEGRWRVFGVQALTKVIQVAQPMSVRQQRAAELALQTLKPFALLLPVLALLIWLAVGHALEPLQRLTAQVMARRVNALESLPDTRLPDEVQPLVGALADAGRIDVGVSAAQPASVHGEPDALRTLLRNLVDNAVRYTPAGGRVDVAVEEANDTRGARLTVSDDGAGIPPAERERVFDRFYRRAGTAPAGSGLGLSIVKTIAESHGASISLAEGPSGKGLTVTVSFPRED